MFCLILLRLFLIKIKLVKRTGLSVTGQLHVAVEPVGRFWMTFHQSNLVVQVAGAASLHAQQDIAGFEHLVFVVSQGRGHFLMTLKECRLIYMVPTLAL